MSSGAIHLLNQVGTKFAHKATWNAWERVLMDGREAALCASAGCSLIRVAAGVGEEDLGCCGASGLLFA